MNPVINKILNEYYGYAVPEIRDIAVLEDSPELGIACIRWRDGDKTITVKGIQQQDGIVLTVLK
jgi:hypothetical protein